MKANVLSCIECGGSLKVSEGQFLTKCSYCGTDYFIDQKFPPVILIKKHIDIKNAKNIVLKKLKNKNVSKEFLKNSYFEKGTLYYIPFVEIRGIKTRIITSPESDKKKFNYLAYEYVERGSELTELSISFIDMNCIEETLANAEQEKFDLVKMRKAGVVLPVAERLLAEGRADYLEPDQVEHHHRIIYLPVWEINYTYRGIIFHSYISAVDGTPIEIKAMKNHRRKLLASITGIALLGILFAKLLSIGLVYLAASRTGNSIATFQLFGILGGGIISIFVFLILFPYFWEIYAFREFLIIRRDELESETINYEENFFTKLMKKIRSGLGKVLEGIKIKVEDE